MDFRKPLFKLEQLSPGLARRFWALTQIKMSPQMLALNLSVITLDDTVARIRIPNHLQNRDEYGFLQTSAITAAAEFASRIIWYRHLNPDLFEMTLENVSAQFLKPSLQNCFCTCEIQEPEREKSLRQLHAGKMIQFETQTLTQDEKGQQISSHIFTWKLRPLKPVALMGGTYGG